METAKAGYDKALKDIETGTSKEKTLAAATKLILGHFDDLNPILSEDSKKAANQRADFASKFKGYEFQQIEGSNDFLIIGKDGKRIEDGHGNAKTLKALTTETAELSFDFAVQSGKTNAGNAGKTGAGAVTVPEDEEAYNNAIFAATSSEEREAITAAYEAAKAS